MSHNSTPSWPSLYNPVIEFFPIEHRDAVQPNGRYLYNAGDIYKFTFYWTIIFYIPPFILCGSYAFFNLTFPPSHAKRPSLRTRPSFPFSPSSYSNLPIPSEVPLRTYTHSSADPAPSLSPELARTLSLDPTRTLSPDPSHRYQLPSRARTRQNERRTRLTFALLVLFSFAFFAVGGAVLGSAVIGYVLAGLYSGGHFNMSTWIPLLGALLQTLVGILGLWPTVIDYM